MSYDLITADKIRSKLVTRLLGSEIYAFNTVNSTNEFARELAQSGVSEGALVIAEEQRMGKGRMKRKWHSSPGRGLWFSIIFRPDIEAGAAAYFPYLISVSIAQALEQTLSITTSLKWPNDLLIDSKKFCGILSEIEFSDQKIQYIIVGIGINVLHRKSDFPVELNDYATSLAIALVTEIDRISLLCDVLQSIESNYLYAIEHGFAKIIEAWKSRCPFIGGRIKIIVDGKLKEGIFKDLHSTGSLILGLDDGSELFIYAGDFLPVE